jgi:hypothetical protein
MAPHINLDAHKELVLSLHAEKNPLPVICKTLLEKHGISLTTTTLRRRIEDWGIKGRQMYRLGKDDALRERVRKLVCEDKLPTKVRFPISRDVTGKC